MSRIRATLFGLTLALHTAIVAAVLLTTELVMLDWQVMLFRPYKQWPELHAMLDYFVVMGQRGPTAVLVAAWLGWRSWRQRTLRPLLVLGTSLLLLNVTVGAVKIGLGRLGPHYATSIGSPELFAGGDIFPSGHTANAVVTWGVLAYLASTPVARRILSLVAAGFALGVGATTVYIGTHWLSDVLLGWTAGLLILLALPWCEPVIARAETVLLRFRDRVRARLGERFGGRGAATRPAPVAAAASAHRPTAVPGRTAAATTAGTGTAVGATATGPRTVSASTVSASSGNAARSADSARPHHTVRMYTIRPERAPAAPVAPGGTRRPNGERPMSRTAHSAGGTGRG